MLDSKSYNYNASKEKFRIRLERQPDGSTNIYISNHMLEANDVDKKGNIIWKNKRPDASREAEMLVRTMEYLGLKRDEAVELFNEGENNDSKVFIDLIYIFFSYLIFEINCHIRTVRFSKYCLIKSHINQLKIFA